MRQAAAGSTINAPNIHDTTPYVSPDETYMIYATSRQGGVGALDLYVAFREGETSVENS